MIQAPDRIRRTRAHGSMSTGISILHSDFFNRGRPRSFLEMRKTDNVGNKFILMRRIEPTVVVPDFMRLNSEYIGQAFLI